MNTNHGRRYALVQVGSLLLASCASAPTPLATEESAREFAATFLRVFEDLDMAKFIECFAEDATVFFPAPETPMRYNDRGAIRDQFQLVFNAIKGDSTAGPPYHRLAPDLLQVQMLGESLAVVTFHLTGPSRVARRTLVLHHRGGRWLIAHLHASNVANR